MKKFFAILLAVLMLLPCIVACGKTKDSDESTSPTTNSTQSTTKPSTNPTQGTTKPSTDSTGGTTDSSTGTGSTEDGSGDVDIIEPEPAPITKWEGSKLNILTTVWSSETGDPGAPWSQPELCVDREKWDYFDDTGFGVLINSAILEREDEIKDKYGVDLNWINSRGDHIGTLISQAVVGGSKDEEYHIAMPRMLEAQQIVAANSIFNLADREYIDLDRSYYNQVAREAYSVYDKTLFVAGDFNFLDEHTSYLIYYNVAMTEGMDSFPDLYQKVVEGKWTIEEMKNVAKLVSNNTGAADWTDDDTYGYGTTNMSRFFQYSGIQQVRVNDETGAYEITLNDSRVGTLIDSILEVTASTWARTSWTGGYGGLENAFAEGRLLFYDEVVEKLGHFTQTEDFRLGILPTPKLSDSQESYYTPCTYQAVLMCIPKSTPDREMSEYFFEILSYTGQKYLMKAYMDKLATNLDAETATESEDVLKNYIFANLCYDVGYMEGWEGLMNSVQGDAYSSGTNKFTEYFTQEYGEAAGTVSAWNLAWFDSDDIVE